MTPVFCHCRVLRDIFLTDLSCGYWLRELLAVVMTFEWEQKSAALAPNLGNFF